MRKLTFEIRKNRIGDRVVYQVRIPNPNGGPSVRKTFKTEEAAKTFADAAKVKQENYGAAGFGITDTLRVDAVRAAEILQGTSASLIDAAKFFAAHHKARQAGVSVTEAVEAYIKNRKIKNPVHLRTLQGRLKYFAAAAADQTTATITGEDVESFLDNLPHGDRTKDHYWSHLRSLFDFCVGKKWCSENPLRMVRRPSVTKGEVGILTPAQARKLLSACDVQIRPGVVIGMFCGLRQAEIEKLDWSAVDIEEGHIRLAAAQVKTRARRIIPIPTNALAWLKIDRKTSGKVLSASEGIRDLWTQARVRAGFGPFKPTSTTVRELQTDPATGKPNKQLVPWPANALRHSAISYKLAIDQDLPKLAYQSGNSPEVIRSHYNGVATPKEAEKFFSILPTSPANIIPMEAVA